METQQQLIKAKCFYHNTACGDWIYRYELTEFDTCVYYLTRRQIRLFDKSTNKQLFLLLLLLILTFLVIIIVVVSTINQKNNIKIVA